MSINSKNNIQSVGIISMHRIENFGSFLQAYCLMKILKKFSNNVEFIDYKIKKPIFSSSKSKYKYRKMKIRNFINEIFISYKFLRRFIPKSRGNGIRYSLRYRKNLKHYLNIDKHNFNSNKDLIIIGSDEVFNCLQEGISVGYSPNLFGHGLKSKNISSYAGSFGNTTYDRLKKANKLNEIKEYFKNFRYISVRDSNSKEILEKLGFYNVSIHLDPVLIYDLSFDIPEVSLKKDYLVVYVYPNRVSVEEKEFIKKYAQLNGLKIISLGNYVDFSDEHIECNPFELLSYINGAKFVFTDTFHGTIYSIIFNKQFITFIRKSSVYGYGNEEKVEYLLDILGLNSRGAFSVEDANIINSKIDYSVVNMLLQIYKEDTLRYFQKIFNQ